VDFVKISLLNIKILVVFLIFSGLNTQILLSQKKLLDLKVTIEFKNKKIGDAIVLLNRKLNNVLSYKSMIFPNQRISYYKFVNSTLKEVLDKVLSGTKIKYIESGKQVILKISDSEKLNNPEEQKTEKLKIGNILPSRSDTISDERSSISESETEVLLLSSLMREIEKSSESTKSLIADNSPPAQNYIFLNEVPIYSFSAPEKKDNKNEEVERPIPVDAGMQLIGSHAFSMSPGFKTNSKTTAVTTDINISANVGAAFSFQYGYWFMNEWQLILQGGVLAAEVNVQNSDVSSFSIIPLLIGARYYPSSLSFWDFGKFYIGAGIGAYMAAGVSVTNNITNVSATETKFGVQSTFGLDMFLTHWLKIGPSATYHLLGSFKEIISEKNYSGAEFSFNMGIVL
jgi:hypothetical protein